VDDVVAIGAHHGEVTGCCDAVWQKLFERGSVVRFNPVFPAWAIKAQRVNAAAFAVEQAR
jgi:hypothetical protein